MPNWVSNSMVFENKDQYNEFKKKYFTTKVDSDGKEYTFFDYNKLIPMPESLNVESGSRTDMAIVFYLTARLAKKNLSFATQELMRRASHFGLNSPLLISHEMERAEEDIKSGKEDPDKLFELGKTYVDNYLNYGFSTWYDWCCANWGTKWNACGTSVNDDNLEIRFDSPWSLPDPIFKKIAEDNPEYDISIYSEEETGWWVRTKIENGNLLEVETGRLDWEDEEEEG